VYWVAWLNSRGQTKPQKKVLGEKEEKVEGSNLEINAPKSAQLARGKLTQRGNKRKIYGVALGAKRRKVTQGENNFEMERLLLMKF